jgi:glycosyltransferase involved in cell wall biosynthesis
VIVGIDGSNIRGGGGIIHLAEVLRSADPTDYGLDKFVIWASEATLAQLEDRPWLIKRSAPVLEKSCWRRALWQRFRLPALMRDAGCQLLFAPGGSYSLSFHPTVVMSQSLLPFDLRETLRYGLSFNAIRLLLLRWSQSRSFKNAECTIFLTRYAKDAVLRVIGASRGEAVIIPHGIDDSFFIIPRTQLPIDRYNSERPFRVIYVSTVQPYKHQCEVAKGVGRLRAEGVPIALDFIGPGYPPAQRRLQKVIQHIDPLGAFIRYLGEVPHKDLRTLYKEADLCLFASSCETISITLLEGMAAGLPIACSDRGPMPEVLGDAGVYFDPEDPCSIVDALRQLVNSPELRTQKAMAAFRRAKRLSWTKCASDTMALLSRVAQHPAS